MSWPTINLSFLSLRGRNESRPLGMMWMFGCSIISSLQSSGQKKKEFTVLSHFSSPISTLNHSQNSSRPFSPPVFNELPVTFANKCQLDNTVMFPGILSFIHGTTMHLFCINQAKKDSDVSLWLRSSSLVRGKANRDLDHQQPLTPTAA